MSAAADMARRGGLAGLCARRWGVMAVTAGVILASAATACSLAGRWYWAQAQVHVVSASPKAGASPQSILQSDHMIAGAFKRVRGDPLETPATMPADDPPALYGRAALDQFVRQQPELISHARRRLAVTVAPASDGQTVTIRVEWPVTDAADCWSSPNTACELARAMAEEYRLHLRQRAAVERRYHLSELRQAWLDAAASGDRLAYAKTTSEPSADAETEVAKAWRAYMQAERLCRVAVSSDPDADHTSGVLSQDDTQAVLAGPMDRPPVWQTMLIALAACPVAAVAAAWVTDRIAMRGRPC